MKSEAGEGKTKIGLQRIIDNVFRFLPYSSMDIFHLWLSFLQVPSCFPDTEDAGREYPAVSARWFACGFGGLPHPCAVFFLNFLEDAHPGLQARMR